jgi:hypothetical protein
MEEFYKYPRTYHLPWSLGSTNDDKFLESTKAFVGKTIVITEKMDGENTNMYPNRIHARSMDSLDHPSRHWVKGEWGRIKNEIPNEWRICGENLYALHSLYYGNDPITLNIGTSAAPIYKDFPGGNALDSYFLVYSIWDEFNNCLSWKNTVDISKSLNLITVPVIDIIVYDEEYLKNLADKLDTERKEGYVIRNIEEFNFNDFTDNVAKWVRPKYVTTDQHWMFREVIPNELKK